MSGFQVRSGARRFVRVESHRVVFVPYPYQVRESRADFGSGNRAISTPAADAEKTE